MTHLFELDTTLFNGIKSSGRNMVVIKTTRAVKPSDTLIFQCVEKDHAGEQERIVVCVEDEGLKNGHLAISFKEKEPNY